MIFLVVSLYNMKRVRKCVRTVYLYKSHMVSYEYVFEKQWNSTTMDNGIKARSLWSLAACYYISTIIMMMIMVALVRTKSHGILKYVWPAFFPVVSPTMIFFGRDLASVSPVLHYECLHKYLFREYTLYKIIRTLSNGKVASSGGKRNLFNPNAVSISILLVSYS